MAQCTLAHFRVQVMCFEDKFGSTPHMRLRARPITLQALSLVEHVEPV